jgi:hypothetical protein
LIEAREVSLAGELVDYLSSKLWTPEEHANIEMAIDYFKNEFSQRIGVLKLISSQKNTKTGDASRATTSDKLLYLP